MEKITAHKTIIATISRDAYDERQEARQDLNVCARQAI